MGAMSDRATFGSAEAAAPGIHAASTRSFAIPVAFTADGQVVRPGDAGPGREYRCPGCGTDVVLRRGEVRRPHFAHRHGEACSAEGTLHRAAKALVIQVVRDWKDRGGPRPCVSRTCPRHGCDGGVTQDLPDDISHVASEVRLPDGSVADVVLFRGDAHAAAVEIRATHSVDPEKARRMAIPWVELDAAELLERPYWWTAVQDGLQPFRCFACAERAEQRADAVAEIQARAVEVAQRTGTTLPPSPPYYYAPHACWRCGSEMVVYLWPGSGTHSPRTPPEPIPPAVQHRMTDYWGDYWANCCPRCSVVQGDHHLRTQNAAYARIMTSVDW